MKRTIFLAISVLILNVTSLAFSNSYLIVPPVNILTRLNDYNSAIEIQEKNSDKLNSYFYQYNQHDISSEKDWNFLPVISVQKGFIFSGINLKKDGKSVYFRIKSSSKISNIFEIKMTKAKTFFIKTDITDNYPESLSSPCLPLKTTKKLLPIYHFDFCVTNYSSFPSIEIIFPPLDDLFRIIKGTSVFFLWFGDVVFESIDLIFHGEDDERTVIKSFVNSNLGTNQFLVTFNSTEFSNGFYWWHLEGETTDGIKYKSDSGRLIILDPDANVDSDGDGYNDNEEMARGSKIDDSNDIPLIISSDDNIPKGYRTLQYFYKFDVNDKRYTTCFSISGSLPEGLCISKDGIIHGKPTECGAFRLTISASNQIGHFDDRIIELNIEEPKASTLTFGKGSLKPKEDVQ